MVYIWNSLGVIYLTLMNPISLDCIYTSQQKKPIFDFRGIYLNSGISHHQLIGIELCSDQFCEYTSENPVEIKQSLMSPERDMYRGGGYGPKSGTFSFLKHSG